MSSGTFKTAVARLFGSATSTSGAAEPEPMATFAEGWALPRAWHEAVPMTTLGPLGGAVELNIDPAGWMAAGDATWSLDWAVRDGEGWRRPSEVNGVAQEPSLVNQQR